MGQAVNSNSTRIIERRKALEAAIAAAIEALDLVDGDPDLEEDPSNDEPSLGGGDAFPINYGEHDLEADDSEEEPSLGWTIVFSQTARSFHGSGPHGTATADLEADHDGREPDADFELEPDVEREESHD